MRLFSATRVSTRSSILLASFGTIITTLILVPLLEVAFTVLLSADVAAPSQARTGYAAAIVASSLGVCTGLVSKIVTDRNLGVFREIQFYRTVDLAYWLGSAIVPLFLSMVTGVVTVLVVFLVFDSGDWHDLGMASLLCLGALPSGLLLGIFCSCIGVGLSDPYLGATLAGAIIPITAGVVVPTALYPQTLQVTCQFLPLTRAMKALDDFTGGTELLLALVTDWAISLAWALLGLLILRAAVRHLKNGARKEPI